MRKYTQGWVATTLGVLLSLAFVMWGVENYLRGGHKRDFAAKVNHVEITDNEMNANYERVVLKLKQQAGDSFALTPVVQQQIKSQLLNDLILQSVLVQAAAKAGFLITPIQVVSVIKQMPQFLENGSFSKLRFEQIITRLNYNHDTFLADVSQTLLLNQIASGIVGSSFVLPNELTQSISLLEQKRDIRYAILPSSHFKKPVAEQAITQYYNQNLSEFNSPEKIQLEYLQLSADDLKKKITISEQELTDYLNTNSISKNDSNEVQKAKDNLLAQKVEQEFTNLSDKLADLTYTNPNSLQEAAGSLELKVLNTDYFAQPGGTSGITKNPKILNTVFNPDFIKGNTNSNLIETAPGTVVVVRIKDHKFATPLPLAEVKDKITQKLSQQEAQLQAKQKGELLLGQITNSDSFNKSIAQAGFTIVEKRQIKRSQSGLDKQLIQVAFNISPKSDKQVAGAVLENGDYLIVHVSNIADLPISKVTSDQRTNFSRVYTDLYGKSEYELYIQNQMDKAKIKLPPNKKSS
jgi:peptidyl-prolyl cis-trans isomerase D